jgi:hypothetical protein
MIVIAKPQFHTLPEALRRLWYRDRGNAVLLGAVVAMVGLVVLLLGLGLPVGGVYLIASGSPVQTVLGVVITLAGPYLANRFLAAFRPRVENLAWLVVGSAISLDAQNAAPLTRYEREAVEALREMVARVRDAAQRTANDGDWTRMRPLRDGWVQQAGQHRAALSRTNNVVDRFEMIQILLNDGGQHEAWAATFAKMTAVIAEETDAALADMLAGRPVPQGGTTWPVYYRQGRDYDHLNHGGEPASLREALERKARGHA